MSNSLLYLLVINTIAFLCFGIDKGFAINQKQRISERTLLNLVFIGGTFGAGLGMLLFRHKIAKRSFLFSFFIIVAIQAIAFYFFINPER